LVSSRGTEAEAAYDGGVPQYCLAHLRSKEDVYPNAVRYRYDLWSMPVISQPTHGQMKRSIVCGTCRIRLIYQVSGIAEVRRGRRMKSAAGLAVLITGAGWITAGVLLLSGAAPSVQRLAAEGLVLLLFLFVAAIVLLSSISRPEIVQLLYPDTLHTLRPPGSTERIESHSDIYVM